jgi:hypothetical protein
MLQDFAAEFVTKHKRFLRCGKVEITHTPYQLAHVVAVVTNVQIGTAYSAAQDVEQNLSWARLGLRLTDNAKLSIFANDGFHADPNGECWPRGRRHGIARIEAGGSPVRTGMMQKPRPADTITFGHLAVIF